MFDPSEQHVLHCIVAVLSAFQMALNDNALVTVSAGSANAVLTSSFQQLRASRADGVPGLLALQVGHKGNVDRFVATKASHSVFSESL